VRSIVLHDGGSIRLRKVGDDYDPSDRAAALGYLEGRREAGEVVTGLLYLRADAADMHDMLDTIETPLNALGKAELVPGSAALAEVNQSLR
jgi:2-oxoglutarate ferredoxin oxidoreductase subunit beta